MNNDLMLGIMLGFAPIVLYLSIKRDNEWKRSGKCKWGCGRDVSCESCGKCDSGSCYAGCISCDKRSAIEIYLATK